MIGIGVIGVHAERVDGDDRVVRWVFSGPSLPAGRVRRAPGRLGELLDDTTLSDALVEPSAVWLWLGDGSTWTQHGRTVQAAVRDALADPRGWEITPAPGQVLEQVTADLLAGSVGDFVRSHGGSVAAQRDGEDVVVRLGGACEHCAAAELTLRTRLLDAVRRRLPAVVEAPGGAGQLRLRLSTP